MSDEAGPDLLELTATIVVAHLAGNPTVPDAVPALVGRVYRTLAATGQAAPEFVPQAPAVPLKKSVFPDYIVCLEDGKHLKMLKRHLSTRYNMTLADYRAKWRLPVDYPMVAPNYAARRSDLARAIGLGRKAPSAPSEPTVTQIAARRAKGSRG